jgi:hypothetical protein
VFVSAAGARVLLGAPWCSLVLLGGSLVHHMRQVQPGIGHARNRLSEPVAKAYSLVLRAVLAVHTGVGVAHECEVDFTGHARQAQCVYEGMAERMAEADVAGRPKSGISYLLVALTIGTEIACYHPQ